MGKADSKFDVALKHSKIGAKFKQDSAHVKELLEKMAPSEIIKGLQNKPRESRL